MHPHERDTDDAAALLGGGPEVKGNFQQQHNESIEMSVSDKTHKDCCVRLARMAKHWEQKQKDCFKVGVGWLVGELPSGGRTMRAKIWGCWCCRPSPTAPHPGRATKQCLLPLTNHTPR